MTKFADYEYADPADVEGLRRLRAEAEAIMLSRPRRSSMTVRWVRGEQAAGAALGLRPAHAGEVARARREVLRAIEALRGDTYEPGKVRAKRWAL
jgi:hypothetical protein